MRKIRKKYSGFSFEKSGQLDPAPQYHKYNPKPGPANEINEIKTRVGLSWNQIIWTIAGLYNIVFECPGANTQIVIFL